MKRARILCSANRKLQLRLIVLLDKILPYLETTLQRLNAVDFRYCIVLCIVSMATSAFGYILLGERLAQSEVGQY